MVHIASWPWPSIPLIREVDQIFARPENPTLRDTLAPSTASAPIPWGYGVGSWHTTGGRWQLALKRVVALARTYLGLTEPFCEPLLLFSLNTATHARVGLLELVMGRTRREGYIIASCVVSLQQKSFEWVRKQKPHSPLFARQARCREGAPTFVDEAAFSSESASPTIPGVSRTSTFNVQRRANQSDDRGRRSSARLNHTFSS